MHFTCAYLCNCSSIRVFDRAQLTGNMYVGNSLFFICQKISETVCVMGNYHHSSCLQKVTVATVKSGFEA